MEKRNEHNDRSKLLLTAAIIILLSVIRLWLANSMALTAWTSDIYDEGLFVRQALQISSGNWLGDFYQLTLFKGPFYPIFLSLAFYSGIRILLFQQMFYVLACLVCLLALIPLFRSPGPLLCLYAILLFNPATLASDGFFRLLREGIYASLTLLVFAGLVGILSRIHGTLRGQLPWSILLGFSYLAFYLTREERIWLTPTLFIALAFYVGMLWKKNTKFINWVIIPAIPFLIGITGVLGVKLVNAHYYDAFMVTEYEDAAFTTAYGSLLRVMPAVWRPLIPVARETRERIYAVSPAFSELSAYLEGPAGKSWQRSGEWFKKEPDEIGGGWFIWAFREAVASQGYYESIDTAREYYNRLSKEINSACDSGVLDCGPAHHWANPVWNAGYIKPLVRNFFEGVARSFSFANISVNDSGCSGTLENVRLFEAFSGDHCAAAHPRFSISGWAFSDRGELEIKIMAGGEIVQSLSKYDSPDVFESFYGQLENIDAARVARFDTEFSCETKCTVVFLQGDQTILTVDPSVSSTGDISNQASGFYGNIERLDTFKSAIQDFPQQYRMWLLKSQVISWLIRVYQVCFPVIGLVSMLLFILGIVIVLVKKTGIEYPVINSMLLAALVSRWFVLAYIQSSSFTGMNPTYLSPSYALIILFCFLSIWQAISMIKHTDRSAHIK